MRTRFPLLAAVFAAALVAGCGDSKKCTDQTPAVNGVPSCTAVANSQVTVSLHVCPRCDQGAPACTVDMTNVGSNAIELVPLSEVCDPSNSCALVNANSCPYAPANCTFTAPSTPGTYDLIVITPDGVQIPNKTLTVVSSGAPSCANWSL